MSEVDIAPAMTHAEAIALTESIHDLARALDNGLEGLADLVNKARDGRADVALGYESWPAYLVAVVGSVRTDDRDQRRVLVGYLSEQGLSTRAIAPIVGKGKSTVQEDLSTVQNRTVDEPEPEAAQPITGLNGKTYRRPDRRPDPESPIVDDGEIERQRLAAAHAASTRRAAAALRDFLHGWPIAQSLRRDPNRDDTLAALDDYDRNRFLTIESEHLT